MNEYKVSEETFLDKAIYDYNVANIIWDTLDTDAEVYIQYVEFWLQQSVEKALRFILDQNDVSYDDTHSIEQLIYIGHENDIDLHLDDYVEDHAEMFNAWGVQTQRVLDYKIEFHKVEKAISKVGDYIKKVENSNQLISVPFI